MKVQIDFEGESRLFKNPIKTFICNNISLIAQTIDEITQLVNQGFYAVGYLAYEASSAFNQYHITKDWAENKLPLLLFGIYKEYHTPTQDLNYNQSATLSLNCNTSEPDYQHNITKIKQYIESGITYQTNYTVQFHSEFNGDPYAFYQFLQQHNEADYCAYIQLDDLHILSISPELFFKTQNHLITTKPMKGTTARGINLIDDDLQLRELFSEKNQAENMMIVDLLRNDLSKISIPGTVNVSQLFSAEKYPTVWQLTSTIQAELKPDTALFDILTALFPCGSITGAPKASTMQIIADIEKQPREVYCGTIGYIEPNFKQTIFNIPIRTLTVHHQQATYGVGGGITWDSTASNEYQEIINKTAMLNYKAIKPEYLIECFLCQNQQIYLLDEHLNRLTLSAQFFNFKHDLELIRKDVKHIEKLDPKYDYKIRLCLREDGHYTLDANPILLPMQISNITLATHCIKRDNIFIYHKTSNRSHLPEIESGQEILLYNESRQITEFVNGNIALFINNQWLTPELTSGLLPGVMREHYLKQAILFEATLSIEDILKAEKMAFINSVRKWINIHDLTLTKLKQQIQQDHGNLNHE